MYVRLPPYFFVCGPGSSHPSTTHIHQNQQTPFDTTFIRALFDFFGVDRLVA